MRWRPLTATAVLSLVAAFPAVSVARPLGVDPAVPGRSMTTFVDRKREAAQDAPPPILGTLVHTHTGERVVLDSASPAADRFERLLSDRVTGQTHTFDARLLGLLRSLAGLHPGARIELVSGFRSPKLNEMMRKKGRKVASHSQHSLGHAVDFRVVPAGAARGIDPRDMEKEIRGLGWDGGVGVYPMAHDWFVHADVGANRRW